MTGYDITDATMDGAQFAPRAIDWARICGLPHEDTDERTGLGLVLRSDGGPWEVRECSNCLEIRADYDDWKRSREGAA